MKKNSFRIVGMLFCFTFMLLMPHPALADGNIFTIISNKMISTVKDLRTIVYVLGGFGLIMFTTMAIFNKISFKHLSYICISLFLLSVMMPVIDYFAGSTLATEADLRAHYGDHTSSINPSGTVEQGMVQKICGTSGENCPEGMGPLPGTPSLIPTDPLAKPDDGQLASVNLPPSKAACEAQGMRLKNGQCVNKKNALDYLNDAISAGKSIASGISNTTAAINQGKQAYENAINGATNSIDAIKNIGSNGNGIKGTLDSITNAFNTVGSATSSVTSSATRAIGNVQGAIHNGGEFASTVSGTDQTSGANHNPVSDALAAIRQEIDDTGSAITGVTSTGSGLSSTGSQIINEGERLGNTVENL